MSEGSTEQPAESGKQLTKRSASFDFDDLPDEVKAARAEATADPMIGRSLDAYCIEKRLGQSDRTDVYLAHHTELGTPVAVKILNDEISGIIAQDEERFHSLVQARAAIQHTNILRIEKAGREGSRFYLITEYVDGSRLEARLDEAGILPPKPAIKFLKQIATAVHVAHEAGIVDYQINPFNILVDKTGMIKASLFGLTQFAGSGGVALLDDTSARATQYVAPEAGQALSASIYAMGCILFRMLCGKPGHAGSTPEEVAQARQQTPVPDPRENVPAIPQDLADLVMKMMATTPEERPATLEEVVQALDSLSIMQKAKAEATGATSMMTKPSGLKVLFANMAKFGASDLHLQASAPPVYRIRGEARRTSAPPFTPEQLEALFREALEPEQMERVEAQSSYDFSLEIEEIGRYRVNLFKQRGSLAACVRAVRVEIPSLQDLLLPQALGNIPGYKDGLVLVTGPTGSGKSTTLAAIINLINETRRAHIITIEDPIEYYHRDKMSLVTQREIGIDTPDFLAGLRDAMRQDPDVILLGELRDDETVATAISASETGHVVMGTLHATNTTDAIQRLLNFFDHARHKALRELLGHTMRVVVGQRMVAGATEQRPTIPIVEILFVNGVVAQCIADEEDTRIPKQFEAFAHEGMQSFNMSLFAAVQQGLVHPNIALQESVNRKELEQMLGHAGNADVGTSGQFQAVPPS